MYEWADGGGSGCVDAGLGTGLLRSFGNCQVVVYQLVLSTYASTPLVVSVTSLSDWTEFAASMYALTSLRNNL
jgi:hypothetical protein